MINFEDIDVFVYGYYFDLFVVFGLYEVNGKMVVCVFVFGVCLIEVIDFLIGQEIIVLNYVWDGLYEGVVDG